MLKRWLLYVGSVLLGLAVVGGLLGAFVLALLYPTLPSLESLTDYQPKIPLRIVSAEGDLLGEFGEERRAVVAIGDVPDVMKKAILAAEDERFFSHGGVDYFSVLRAAVSNVSTGSQQGAGTITMQVARNFFLTREKTLTRKLREVLLAWKIEANLSKDEILELYINQIFLGQRAYGFGAAAQIYFGKPLKDVTVAEAAMLAGLPKAPSAYNPVSNPKRAKIRQLYVLRRMHDLRFIDDAQFHDAQTAPLNVRQGLRDVAPTHAEFVAEMARQVVFEAYGEDAYTRGLDGLHDHPAGRPGGRLCGSAAGRARLRSPARLPRTGGVRLAARRAGRARRGAGKGVPGDLGQRRPRSGRGAGSLRRRGQGGPRRRRDRFDPGRRAQVRRPLARRQGGGDHADPAGCRNPGNARRKGALGHRPDAAGRERLRLDAPGRRRDAVARRRLRLRPQQVQSRDAGLAPAGVQRSSRSSTRRRWRRASRPATVVNDAPFFVPAEKAGGEDWEPKNYDGKFDGPMRVRTALAKSKNLVTVRVLQAIGPRYAQDYIARFGFDPKLHPPYLTMGLGAGSATPLQMVDAYACSPTAATG